MQATIRTHAVKRRKFPMVAAALVVDGHVIHTVLRWSENGAVTDLAAFAIKNRITVVSVN